ncbi:hypothetical protein HK097_003902 [Rhizophlyctis rosea]|uniref:Rad4-domain-containing protein n=1 Tax=Rhizophlyctis rosea TaxID=64517 RepID=A0AAD5S269_9FUNG|nr:hypothetical protein HK097_003902 [Rhizophlyctis rosea]
MNRSRRDTTRGNNTDGAGGSRGSGGSGAPQPDTTSASKRKRDEQQIPGKPTPRAKRPKPNGNTKSPSFNTPSTLQRTQTEWEEEISTKGSTSNPTQSTAANRKPVPQRKGTEWEEDQPKPQSSSSSSSSARSPPSRSLSNAAKRKEIEQEAAALSRQYASSSSITTPAKRTKTGTLTDSDEEEEWEEVGGDEDSAAKDGEQDVSTEDATIMGQFELVIPTSEVQQSLKEASTKKDKARGIRKEDRLVRAELHKTHLLCLLISGLMRNRWCDDAELQNITTSLIPKDIATRLRSRVELKDKSRATTTSSRSSSSARKNEIPYFGHYISTLLHWWHTQFKTSKTSSPPPLISPDAILEKIGTYMSLGERDVERVMDPEVSALAFLSVLRGFEIESRLVCALFPVALSFTGEKKKKGKGGGVGEEQPVVPMRLWCEVWSEKNKEWIPVDPVLGLVNDTVGMEPPSGAIPQLQLSYVVAYEQGFGIKDVTRRYTSQWGAKTSKLRLPPGEGEEWWERTLWLFSGNKDERGRKEEEGMKEGVVKEAMPTSLAGFKDHPLYALERHLKKHEIIWPSGVKYSIGRFKNDNVYPRALVKELRTPESWLRLGRQVIPDEQPIKFVKAHAATINRKRMIEMKKMEEEDTGVLRTEEDGDPEKSGVFGEWQTREFVPESVVDGRIPKNTFGNVEVFHKRMVPRGAVHLACEFVICFARS